MSLQQVIAEGSGPTAQQVVLLVVTLAAGYAFLRFMRRPAPKDSNPRQYRREIESAAGQNAAIQRDIEQLLVELDRLGKDVGHQVEGRFNKLEQIIDDADKRISALRILLDAAKKAGASLTEPPVNPLIPDSTIGDSLRDAGRSGVNTDSQVLDVRTRRIYELADQGLSPVQIARKLDQHTGEVELILNLRDASGTLRDST